MRAAVTASRWTLRQNAEAYYSMHKGYLVCSISLTFSFGHVPVSISVMQPAAASWIHHLRLSPAQSQAQTWKDKPGELQGNLALSQGTLVGNSDQDQGRQKGGKVDTIRRFVCRVPLSV